MRLHNRRYLKGYRKNLRNNLTPAENRLWLALKGKKLAGYKFRRQHSVENYILDFYCFSEKMAIELDGGYHQNASIEVYDAKRQAYLESLGIQVLRFRNEEVIYNLDAVLDTIYSVLRG